MRKNDGWITGLAIIAGAALLAKLLDEANKNKGKIYRCWRCSQVLSKGELMCPHCHASQNWRGLE